MAKKNSNTPIRFDKFDVDNVVITEPEENEMVKAQKLSYPRYKNGDVLGQLLIKTPVINIFSGGIPSLGEYFKDDKSRAKNFKIPFDPSNKESQQLMSVMEALDNLMNSDKFRSDVMNNAKNLEYQPIIRVPVVDEDDDSKPARPTCMKLNIALDYNTDKVQTQLFVKNEEGKREPTKVETLDELCKYVHYKSNVRLIILANKFYVMKNPDPKTKKKTYGMTWKVMQVEVDAPSNTAGGFDNTVDNFDDSDDEKPMNKDTMISTLDLDEGIEDEVPKSKKGKGKKDKVVDA